MPVFRSTAPHPQDLGRPDPDRLCPTASGQSRYDETRTLKSPATENGARRGGRLVLGTASGDRAVEFPAYGIEHTTRGERFAEPLPAMRRWWQPSDGGRAGHAWTDQGLQLLPSPTARIPLIITDGARADFDAAMTKEKLADVLARIEPYNAAA
ncbi:LLM class flavin-dependent oxidoreductase [Streptomyces sp. SID10244]|nr:LLM class flavin-dependent oxidoreductase [Streptomyces sp. SID10244]